MDRAWLAVVLLIVPATGLACSPEPGYRVPTNIELLQKADLVVLARVASGPMTFEPASFDEPQVILKLFKVLKGAAPTRLRVKGILSDRDDRPYPPNPTGLNDVHPSALEGACIRQRYARGAMVLAMFRRTARGYEQLGDPFARSVEDVEGQSALWPRAADLYLRVLRIPGSAKRRAIFQQQQLTLAASKSRYARAVAADIGQYLKVTRK